MSAPDFNFDRDRHTDVIDIASEVEAQFTNSSINQQRALAQQDQKPNAAGEYETVDCVECDQPIGAERLKVAPRNCMCVYCASIAERRK